MLLEHPTARVDGRPAPVLALWEYGRGRALALMTDDSWTWAFTARRAGGQSRHYDRFWGNALRWLVRDPDLTSLQVLADPPTVEPGRPPGAVVTARQPDYQPAASAEVRVELFSLADRKVLQTRSAVAGADGVARVSFDPVPVGAYKLRATARLRRQGAGRGGRRGGGPLHRAGAGRCLGAHRAARRVGQGHRRPGLPAPAGGAARRARCSTHRWWRWGGARMPRSGTAGDGWWRWRCCWAPSGCYAGASATSERRLKNGCAAHLLRCGPLLSSSRTCVRCGERASRALHLNLLAAFFSTPLRGDRKTAARLAALRAPPFVLTYPVYAAAKGPPRLAAEPARDVFRHPAQWSSQLA